MPSDSQFAIAMRNQQEAEREEQRRIKSHILNLDFQDSGADGSGTAITPSLDPFASPNPNLRPRRAPLGSLDRNGVVVAYDCLSQGLGAAEKHPYNASLGRSSANNTSKGADKSSSNRRGERSRKLQLSDVDWYGLTFCARWLGLRALGVR